MVVPSSFAMTSRFEYSISLRSSYAPPALPCEPKTKQIKFSLQHKATLKSLGRSGSFKHGDNENEIVNLAVLMQNTSDTNMGSEWLTLKPEVPRAAVNAVVRSPDNSFDASGVIKGHEGLPEIRLPKWRVNIDENGQGHILDTEGNRTATAVRITPTLG